MQNAPPVAVECNQISCPYLTLLITAALIQVAVIIFLWYNGLKGGIIREVLVVALFLFVIIIPLVLAINIPIYEEHRRSCGGITNYDSSMRKFVYKTNLSRQEIVNLLNTKNVVDELSCAFDFEKSVIRFSEYGSHIDYYFKIYECNGFSILRLEQVALIGMKSAVRFKLNPFIVNKLQAEIIPFSQYGF